MNAIAQDAVRRSVEPAGRPCLQRPLMGGLLVTAIVSGRLISRTGRHIASPIAGTAVMTIGMPVLSRLDVSAPAGTADAYLSCWARGSG